MFEAEIRVKAVCKSRLQNQKKEQMWKSWKFLRKSGEPMSESADITYGM